ncbi:MAG TPA: MarR family winged helix-turn-helix transcriptional regulator, partial [Roseimicrobium sp.]|nr:MarR family winged helix-turn-helix transcriptional regulator [Roseimicrobium sp.]
MRKHFRATEQRVGISGAHVWALSVVNEHPKIGVGALATVMDVHQSTASNLVRLLLAEDLVAAERTSLTSAQSNSPFPPRAGECFGQ